MDSVNNLPVLVVIIPLLSAILTPIIGRIIRSAGWYMTVVATFTVFMMALSLLFSVLDGGAISYSLGGWEPPWGIEYVVDYISGFVMVVVSLLAFIVAVYARRSVELEIAEDKASFFYAAYLLFLTGLMGMTITGDMFNLYVFVEITSLAVYALIAMGKRREALIASFNYLILGTIAGTFILIGVGYLYMATGTLNMADLRRLLPALYNTTLVRTAFAFFTVGLSLKLALFPFHIWLPNAYTQAPSVVSAFVAATATKVGAYVLMRIMFNVFTVRFNMEVIPVTSILLALSSLAIIAGSVIAISQTNIKRMLAYSSIGQIGYIVFGVAIANDTAVTGSIVHIFNHALMKGSLFMVVGAVVYRTGIEDIAGLKGMGKKMPFTMAAFTIGALSMIGVPLTVGFVSKWYLILGALEAHMWYLVPVVLISSLLTAVYFWRVVESIYFHHTDGEESIHCVSSMNEAPAIMTIPAFLLAFFCILFGIAAFLPVSVASTAAKMLLGVV